MVVVTSGCSGSGRKYVIHNWKFSFIIKNEEDKILNVVVDVADYEDAQLAVGKIIGQKVLNGEIELYAIYKNDKRISKLKLKNI